MAGGVKRINPYWGDDAALAAIRTPTPRAIRLPQSCYVYAYEVGKERQRQREADGHYDWIVSSRFTPEQIHGMGAVCEYAFCRQFGLRWLASAIKKPRDIDAKMPDGTPVEVRSSSYRRRPWLRFYEYEFRSTASLILVLMAWEVVGPEIAAVGWGELEYLRTVAQFKRSDNKQGGFYHVNAGDLRDLLEMEWEMPAPEPEPTPEPPRATEKGEALPYARKAGEDAICGGCGAVVDPREWRVHRCRL